MPITPGPRLPDANTWTQRMLQGATNNAQRWLDGATHPTKSPKAEAMKAGAKWAARTQEAIQNKSYERGVANYDEDAALEAMQKAGTTAYVNGITSRERKIRGRIQQLHGHLSAHVQAMDAMPANTSQEAEAKMIANLRGMREIGKKMKGNG